MPNRPLADLAARYWDFQCEEFPITAIMAGVPTEAVVLMRDAPKDHERRAAWARTAEAELSKIDVASLDLDDQATFKLLARELRGLIDAVETSAHLRPSLYPLGPEFTLNYWAGSTALATVADARRYIDRLAAAPQSMANVQASLKAGAERGVRYSRLTLDRAIEQVNGMISAPPEASAFFGPLARVTKRSEAFERLAEEGRAVVADAVYPAIKAYADFLASTLLPLARESLSCVDDLDGEDFYQFQIRTFATVDDAPADIHALGLSEVERLTGEMLVVAADAGFENDLEGFRRRLQTDNSQFAESGEALREQIEILSKRIDGRIPEFFGRIPRITYAVKSIPEAIAEKMPPAYAQPNPADNSGPGVHWITSMPGKCPRYMHLPLALHEAWPGHLMHLALIQEMEHLPAFRRYGAMNYSACLEGWALYCEALGEDMGFYDTPEKRYGRLEMEMWRAVRLVVDTGLHVKDWTRQQSIDFFRQHMALPLETVTAEVDRYVALPAQALGYQLGNLKFREIRRRAEAELGEGFNIRDFHDALMAAGPVTLPVLDDLMSQWIATRKTALAA